MDVDVDQIEIIECDNETFRKCANQGIKEDIAVIDWKKTGTCLHILAQDDKECADSDRALPVYLLKSSEVDSLIENARPGDVFEEIPVINWNQSGAGLKRSIDNDGFVNEDCTITKRKCNVITDLSYDQNYVLKSRSVEKRKCCVCHISSDSGLFSFPKIYREINGKKCLNHVELERCLLWIKHVGEKRLLHLDLHKLFICSKHFTEDQFSNFKKNRLNVSAVPTIFTSNPLSEVDIATYKLKIHVLDDGLKFDSNVNDVNNIQCDDDACLKNAKSIDENLIMNEYSNCDLLVDVVSDEQIDVTMETALIVEVQNNVNTNNDITTMHCAVSDKNGDNTLRNVDAESCKKISGMRGKKCCVPNCVPDIGKSMFMFPRLTKRVKGKDVIDEENITRCSEWLKRCGQKNLLDKNPFHFHKHYYLCANHFKADQLNKSRPNRLISTALPSIFDCNPLPHGDVDSLFMTYKLVKSMEIMCDNITQDSNNNVCNESNDLQYGIEFEEKMKKLDWFTCDECSEKHLVWNVSLHKCVHDPNCSDYSDKNNMDPGEVPPELKDLTFVEEQLIALVHPVISVFKLKGLQYGYAGNVINFCQDVKQFAKVLPHQVEDLSNILTVIYKSEKHGAYEFQVRAKKVRDALIWLKDHNPYYDGIEISENNLKLLPEDGNVFDQVQSVVLNEEQITNENVVEKIDDICDNDKAVNNETDDSDDQWSNNEDKENETYPKVHYSGIPNIHDVHMDDQVRANVFDWPNIDNEPINELKTVGYIARAFPTLFPYGKADLRAPRHVKIETSNYFRHLLNYKDDRFAQHKTFRFFALNSWMRWTALSDGSLFVANNKEFADINIGKLKEMLQEHPNLVKKMMFYASNLRGTKQYWSARCSELLDMVEQLGLPTIFLTMSCADLHWHDLFRVLTGNNELTDLSEKDRRKLLQENPKIVNDFFALRVKCFVENVLKPKFKIKDHWYRIEYQHRGSPHMHGIFWFEDAVDVANIKSKSKEELDVICKYFENITAVNPQPDCCRPEQHPCRINYKDVKDPEKDLAQLLKMVQTHSRCHADYCLRKEKKTGRTRCRFKFPFQPEICNRININDTEIEYFPKRNDRLLNKFEEYILKFWRANIDIAPVLSKKALITYLAKYISKSEVKSNTIHELFNNILNDFGDETEGLKAIHRLLIKTCSERDYSAQEVCHILSGNKLFCAGGRDFCTINFNRNKDWTEVPMEEENRNKSYRKGKSVIEKYKDRPSKFENCSLFEAAINFDLSKWSKKRKCNIIRVFPKLYRKLDNDDNEDYFRQMVLLHVPWRNESLLKPENASWKEIYDNHDVQAKLALLLDLNMVDNAPAENEFESEDEIYENDVGLEDSEIAARLSSHINCISTELGMRETDTNHDWTEAINKYLSYGSVSDFVAFIQNHRQNEPEEDDIVHDLENISFSEEQHCQ